MDWVANVRSRVVAAGLLVMVLVPAMAGAQQESRSASADLAPAAPGRQVTPADYVIGPKDLVGVSVWNQPALSGKFTVDADGTLAVPLVGRMPAAGLSVRAFETALVTRLADGFLTKPEVSITIEEYRSQRVFVVGEVRQPGPIPLTGRTTLIEILALARSTTGEAAKEAVIVRPAAGTSPTGAILPGQPEATEVIRVDLVALETGALSNNIVLKDGDTIFVPRAPTVVVFGQVRSPGVYPIGKTTTIVEVLALAGGVADRGAANRIRILRIVGGKKVELKAKLGDLVRPGDTLIVPERLF
jgi:polysaccharide export outer membrane protein